MILFIDNYDSFTYNLVDYFGQYEPDLLVKRNDKISLEEIASINPDGIVLSPGPGNPGDAGICNDVIRAFYKTKKIFGVCLGMQVINEVFAGKTVNAPVPVHGKKAILHHSGRGIFANLAPSFSVARYHSLACNIESDSLVADAQAWQDAREWSAIVHVIAGHYERVESRIDIEACQLVCFV